MVKVDGDVNGDLVFTMKKAHAFKIAAAVVFLMTAGAGGGSVAVNSLRVWLGADPIQQPASQLVSLPEDMPSRAEFDAMSSRLTTHEEVQGEQMSGWNQRFDKVDENAERLRDDVGEVKEGMAAVQATLDEMRR